MLQRSPRRPARQRRRGASPPRSRPLHDRPEHRPRPPARRPAAGSTPPCSAPALAATRDGLLLGRARTVATDCRTPAAPSSARPPSTASGRTRARRVTSPRSSRSVPNAGERRPPAARPGRTPCPGARTFFIIGITSYHSAVERRVAAERHQQEQHRDGAERPGRSRRRRRSPSPRAASTHDDGAEILGVQLEEVAAPVAVEHPVELRAAPSSSAPRAASRTRTAYVPASARSAGAAGRVRDVLEERQHLDRRRCARPSSTAPNAKRELAAASAVRPGRSGSRNTS